MDGFGDSESSKDRQPWTLEEMLEHKEKWNLAGDVGVLEYLQKFGNDLLGETENTLKLLDSFEADLNSSCIQVSNITNKFLSLADTQFVENLVREDEETPAQENAVPSVVAKTKQEEEKEISDRLKEAISNGLNVLKTKFETVEVVNSDSEDDGCGTTGVVYKPINPFNNRPLPHLIGSVEFMKDPTVGLEDPASDEEEESIGESLSSESKAASEDNDESESDSDQPNTVPVTNEIHSDLADILYKQPISSSFADHLTKRLEDMDNERKIKSQPQKPGRSLFSTTPPPLDDSYDDDYGSSDDLIFGNRNNQKPFDDDLFVPKSNSALWNDERDNDFPRARDVSDDINERRKNAMSDFERELSKTLQKRKGYDDDDDLYNDILSPSPPPLDKQIGDSFDDLRYGNDNVSSNEPKYSSSANPKSESNDQFYSQESNEPRYYKDAKDVDVIAKSISNLRRRNYGGDDTDEDSVVNNDTIDTEDVNNSIFKTMTQQDVSKSSSRSSSVKMSESFQDDNLSIKSNRSAGLFDDVVTNTTKKNAIKKNMDDLFSDLNYRNGDGSDEDDLFGNYVTKGDKRKNLNVNDSLKTGPSETSTSKAMKVDDLFGDIDNDDLFSKLNITTKKPKPKTTIPENNKDSFINKTNIIKEDRTLLNTTSKKVTGSLFDGDDDDIDVFGSGNEVSNVKNSKSAVKSNLNKPAEASSSVSSDKKKRVSSLFEDMDDSDLFGDGNKKESLFDSDLFSSISGGASKKSDTQNVLSDANKNPVSSLFSDETDENDGLFSDVTTSSTSKNKRNDDSIDSNVTKVGVSNNLKEDESRISSEVPQDNSSVVNRNYVKTANVKHISLISDKASDIETNSLFPNTAKNSDFTAKENRNDKPVPFVTDDSPLFSENRSKLFNDVETDPKTKILDTSGTSANDSQSKVNSMFQDELFNRTGHTHLISRDEPATVQSGSSLDTGSENIIVNTNNSKVLNSKDVSDSSLNVQNTHSIIDHNDCLDIEKSNESSSLVDNTKTSENKTENFDVNKSLPNIPPSIVQNKKPEVKPKPNKPEPPKSLNIRAPISVQPLHEPSGSKVASIKQSLDVADGGIFSSEKSNSSEKSAASPRAMPGKLNLEKTLRIDPKTLLPGARPISFKKSSSPSESKESVVPVSIKSPSPVNKTSESDKLVVASKDLSSSETSSVQNSEPVLHSIAKDRVKIQVKRRPQTRKARREAVRQSMVDNADDDETDNSSSITTHSEKEKSNPSSLFEQPSNILSPSTDEEDLFGVPPLDLPADYTKVSMSPGDIFDTPNPTIISPDFSSIETRTGNDSSKYDEKVPKVENSDDVFKCSISNNNNTSNDPINRKGLQEIPKVEAQEDLFSSKKPMENSRGLFDNIKPLHDNAEDLFSDVVTSKEKVAVDKTDDLFGSVKSLKANVEIQNKLPAEKQKPLFSSTDSPDDLFQKSSDGRDKFSSEGILEINQGNDIFVNQKTVVNQLKEGVSSSTPSKGSLDEVKDSRPDILEDTSKIDIFADLNDTDLFAGSSISKTTKTSIETVGEVVKQDSSTNIICNVFNTGVVNICDKLSASPPIDDELFQPSDWSVASDGNRQTNKTITSVPEKIKTDSLFDDNIDDDRLFSKVSSSSKTSSLDTKVPDSLLHKKTKEKETAGASKSKAIDSLFTNDSDDEDDGALFGEIKKKTTKEPLSAPSKVKQSGVRKQIRMSSPNLKSSLFDADDGDDDPDDIFVSSSSKMKNKSRNTNQSLNDAFESSGSVFQSASKKTTTGAIKKLSGSSSSKTSEEKTTDKGNFVDPLSAFADND